MQATTYQASTKGTNIISLISSHRTNTTQQASLAESKRNRRKRRLDQLEIPASEVDITDEVLGRGGFGKVYLADFNGLNAAAKVVVFENDQSSDDEEEEEEEDDNVLHEPEQPQPEPEQRDGNENSDHGRHRSGAQQPLEESDAATAEERGDGEKPTRHRQHTSSSSGSNGARRYGGGGGAIGLRDQHQQQYGDKSGATTTATAATTTASSNRNGRNSNKTARSADRQRKAFMRELEAMKRLRGPHTVHIYGAITSQKDRLVLVMELLPGGDLRHKLRKARQPLDESVLRGIVRDVSSGMAFLHSKKTVHGDLKSANVLFDAAGRAKVMGRAGRGSLTIFLLFFFA